ncbi:Hydrolase protein [Sterolibacterium denitrificans]|uniref:Hydrolase protein n=2 Tax=Sterolibacterium denitrificans TaxID=157592 RepID=A0A7Z7MVV9_9PROT|nr:alpha/beta hydrolase [Sterolibacterium denitrificans]KYC29205.1 alpha/beta hydrolase [Sterolibacterium denitrificans]SMB29616.1 Hydrolase protein [Sterolibacterium denitrificans]
MYPSTSEFLTLRGMRMHVRVWGSEDAPKLFLLHGWQDFSGSFQFLVDALAGEWRCIAPDWRGFGQSQWNHGCYWFPDYLADLDALLDHYSPDAPARIVGHSMGGNVLCVYAGVRPERVTGLVTLEGFGLPAADPEDAPGRYRHWLDQSRQLAPSRRYADRAALAQRLQRLNPRLSAERASFLAEHFGVEDGADSADPARPIVVASDPCHKLLAPYPYRLEEAKACWRRVSAPVLWVEGSESSAMAMYHGLGEDDYEGRMACFSHLRREVIQDAGHNLHHDQPEQLARLIEAFFS